MQSTNLSLAYPRVVRDVNLLLSPARRLWIVLVPDDRREACSGPRLPASSFSLLGAEGRTDSGR